MTFRMSPNVAVRTGQFSEAVEFYTSVLGFQNRSDNPELADLDASPLNLFVIEDPEIRGPVMELFVDDLEKARATLEAAGCQVLRWRGKGQDCYVQDPFGAIFNVWEE
ncbi:MAG: VOC family protein [Anaerolineae bacterium]|jgi:catechol 2,3-dioxygenase-like lactoylglutathione lyase family enzyme